MKKISNKNILAILVIVIIFVLLFSYFYFTKKQTENFQKSDVDSIKNTMINGMIAQTYSSSSSNSLGGLRNILGAIQKDLTNITFDSSGNCITPPDKQVDISTQLSKIPISVTRFIPNASDKQTFLNFEGKLKTSLKNLNII